MNSYQQIPGTPKEILRGIRIFFGAIIAGALLFAVIVVIVNKVQGHLMPEIKEYEYAFLYAAAGIAVVCLIIAYNAYNKEMAVAKNSLIPLTGKLNLYRTALIKYVALCEGPALFGIIVLFMTANYAALIITGIMIAAMLAKAPTRRRVTDDLALDWKQQQELE
ncbi:MAG: hypothetical protein WDO16_21345 [Bacteroidota bacterium]